MDGTISGPDGRPRCRWCSAAPEFLSYHDTEWGFPVDDDRRLFEKLCLEGFQSGLSWRTILNKRENYRRVLHGFDAERIARYTDADRTRLLGDAGIVRNRLKIDATIDNARAVLTLRESGGGLSGHLWNFVDGEPILNHWREMREVPARTDLSDRISKDLKARGFRFVGSTIIYAFMQAMGMVNDHLVSCFRHPDNRQA